jgi:hypothetical protein
VPVTGKTVTVTLKKPDEVEVVYNLPSPNLHDNVADFYPDVNGLNVPGIVLFTLEVYDGLTRITSRRMQYVVTDSLNIEDDVASFRDYPVLTGLIAELQPIKLAEADRVTAENTRQTQEAVREENEAARIQRMVELEGVSSVQFDTRLRQTETQLADIVTLNVESFKTASNTYQNAVISAFNQINTVVTGKSRFRILFPNKNIEMSATIKIKSNTIIDLNGCTIKKANGADFTIFDTDETTLENVTIVNGALDGNSANMSDGTNGRFLFLSNAKNLFIDRITIKNNKTYAITIYSATDVTIQNCKITQDNANTAAGMLLYYANQQGNKRIRVLNNYLYNISGDNIVIGGAISYKGSDCIIQGNIIEKPCSSSASGTRLGAIQCEGGSAQNNIGFENIIIANNIIKNLDATGQLTDGIMIASAKKVCIANNIISDTNYGISVIQSESININNNIIENPKSDGIYFCQIKNTININNNSILAPNSGGVGTCAAIRFHAVQDLNYSKINVIINNNYILLSDAISVTLHPRGIWIWTPTLLTANMGNITIKDNEIDDRNNDIYGIKLESKTYFNLLVEGNRGWKTKTIGTAVIPASTDVVAFNHGLPEAPTVVFVTGTTTESADLYVNSLVWSTNTQIRIKNKTAVTVDTTIYWQAEIKY